MSNELGNERILSFTQTKFKDTKIITLPIKIIKNNTTIIKFTNKPIHISNNQPINKVSLNNDTNNINQNTSHTIMPKKKSCKKMNIYLKKRINNNGAPNQVIMRKVIPPLSIPLNNQSYYNSSTLSNNSRNGNNNLTHSLEFTFQRKKDSDVDLDNYNIKNGLSDRSCTENVNDYSNSYKTHRVKRQINFAPIKTNPFEYELNQAKSIIDKHSLLNNKLINNKHEIYFDFPNRK